MKIGQTVWDYFDDRKIKKWEALDQSRVLKILKSNRIGMTDLDVSLGFNFQLPKEMLLIVLS